MSEINEMNQVKYASLSNLQLFLDNLRNEFSSVVHTHNKNEIVDFPDIDSKIDVHNTTENAHNDIRIEIQDVSTRLNTLADSDDETLDQISEIVEYAKKNRDFIGEITTNKVNVSDIVDNLTTNINNRPLSAAQGVILNNKLNNTENWTFTLSDGTTVTKKVILG